MELRDRIELTFERWTDLVLRWRWSVVVASLLLTFALGVGLRWLEIETSFESYLPRDNPAQRLYERFREDFGSGERVVLLLRPGALYEIAFLEELQDLHEAIEDRLPYLDDVTSLVNARHLVATGDTLMSEGLLEDFPKSSEDLGRLRDRVRANPLYRNYIVAADESATAIVIELDGANDPGVDPTNDLEAVFGDLEAGAAEGGGDPTSELLTTDQSKRLVRVLDEIHNEHAPASAELFVAGTPLLAQRLGAILTRDILLFVSASFLVAGLLLFLLFRSFWATFHPLFIVGLSVIGTLGWMGWSGLPLTAVTEILPSLLVAVGVADAVHIQAMFYKHREDGHDPPACIRWAMGHSGLAVLLTSVTTGASMAAFQAAELEPVIGLGRAAPVGVGLALLFSVALLPALLSITTMDAKEAARSQATARRIDASLLALGRVGTRHPKAVLLTVMLLWLLAAASAATLHFSQDDLRWLPEDDSIRVATEQLNTTMHGAEPLELLLRIRPGTDLREPHVLQAIREIQERVTALHVGEIAVGQSISLVDVIEETHRALGDDPSGPLELPDTRPAVSQELLLFESAAPDDLKRLATPDLRTTRIAITVPFVDALHYPRFSREALRIANSVLEARGLREALSVEATGMMMIGGETFELLFVSMLRSYTIAFSVIALLMLGLIGHLRMGLLSTLPNVTPILLVLGLMGWIDAPLDVSSMLVGGILIGVVVDDTIHFAHNYARYRGQIGCSLAAVRETLRTTGRAMLVTSVVMSLGFFAFTGAWLSNVANFGLLCGIGVILAFLADVVFLPALVALASPCSESCPAHGRRRSAR